jgi:hypothetical protein
MSPWVARISKLVFFVDYTYTSNSKKKSHNVFSKTSPFLTLRLFFAQKGSNLQNGLQKCQDMRFCIQTRRKFPENFPFLIVSKRLESIYHVFLNITSMLFLKTALIQRPISQKEFFFITFKFCTQCLQNLTIQFQKSIELNWTLKVFLKAFLKCMSNFQGDAPCVSDISRKSLI